MSRDGSRVRRLFGAVAVLIALFMTSPHAWAATAGVTKNILAGTGGFPGDADFGSGTHVSGVPTGPYTVTWDYTPVGGVVVVTARVVGTLYVDSFGTGCARLIINFQDINFNNIFSTEPSGSPFCGPGFDANSAANQLQVNLLGPSDSRIRHVQLVVGFGTTRLNIVNDRVSTEFFPGINPTDKIDSGTADLGGPGLFPIHLFGAPVDPYSVGVNLQDNGVIKGEVSGILFWDSTAAGTACAIIDFRDAAGNILATIPEVITGPSGGNALSSTNQKAFDRTFSSASLFGIHVRVGTGIGTTSATANCSPAVLTGVTGKSFILGPAVGLGDGIPFAANTRVGQQLTYGVEWTVPPPENWHSLSTLDVRLVADTDAEAIRIRWDEASNTFSLFQPETGRFVDTATPGIQGRFESPNVAILLDDTTVLGSGPTGPSVLLNLRLQFKPHAASTTFKVEVQARDDSGGVQGWDAIGTISVR
jgi:hypothetical protein